MLVPSRNVIPSWTPRSWARSSSRSHTPRWAQRMNICAARDQGPRSAGMARHLAPFSCRQTIAEIVRRRSWGGVLPLGRHASISGSRSIHAPSVSIALSSFQEGQNARLHNRFKREQALEADEYNESLPGVWTRGLLIRRSLTDGEFAFFTTWCPAGTPIGMLVAVEGRRWAIEDAFETAKTELGLAHNETRSWHGWHRHVSLVMLA